MDPKDFVHLHVHSDFSLLDGAAKVPSLAKAAKECGQIAVALTDHGSVSGIVEFVKSCDKNGVKPIIGCEAYLAPGLDEEAHKRRGKDEDGKDRVDAKTGRKTAFDYDHFSLIAKNDTGWANLRKLASIASLEGFYYRPRMSWALLTKYHEGLIALSGCLSGQLSNAIKQDRHEEAEQHARRWKELFGDDFYIELQPVIDLPANGSESDLAFMQRKANDGCLEIAKRLGIKTVATADVHYVDPGDAAVQELKICTFSHKTIKENRESGLNMPPIFYFKRSEEMFKYFSGYEEAIRSTREIADKVGKVNVLSKKFFLPKFTPPDGSDPTAYFRRLCREGLIRRYGPMGSFELAGRLEYELACIEKMGFVDYFLITQDFTTWARTHGCPVGPGRGSAAGSLVSYCLGITNIDPIRYDLLFERFLNPERVSMPDIDIDFCERNRGRVIEYVRQKYGEKCVAQIITFGEAKAKSAIRDVGRALEIPNAEVNRLAKLIPDNAKPVDKNKTVLQECLEGIPELKVMYETSADAKKLFDLALGLEGLYRSEGKHAAGIVIGDRDLMERIPLKLVPPNKEDSAVCTAFSMEEVEEVGLLKMDFLGLSTMTHIYDTLALIKQTTGRWIDPDTIPVRDKHSMETTKGQHRCPIHEVAFEVCACCDKTLEVFRRAETNGVFQVEGSGMRKLLKQMKPDRFDDLIALVALFRPGPLGSGMDQTYVNRKNGLEELTYEHPKLEPITKETYGVWCYQEQLMQLSVALAGFTLPQADELRKATAKKKPEAMQKIKDKFIPGCVKHGVSEELAKSLWDKIVFFAEYSFNKSHSAAYALIAWHTAWLKASYPLEFMAALFTNWAGDTDKLSGYVDEARRMGIPIELPDINESDAPFTIRMTPGKPKSILYGLDALKGVGGEAVHAILSARQRAGRFRSIFHFCEEVDLKKVTSAVMDTLAKAGAFRSTGATREQILESTTYFTRGKSGRGGAKEITENAIEAATRCAKLEKKDKAAGQSTLFAAVATDPDLPEIRAWSLHKTLVTEKEALGLYLSGHPLDDYADVIREYATVTSAKAEAHGGGSVTMGGIIRGVRRHITTSGKEMAFVSYEDFSGTIDVVCFPNAWEEYKEILQAGLVCFITGELDLDRETPSLRLSAVYTVEEAPARLGISGVVIITLYEGLADPAALRDVGEIIKAHPGRQQIYYKWHNKKTKWTGPLQPLGTASLPPNVRKEIRTILGNGGAVDAVRRV